MKQVLDSTMKHRILIFSLAYYPHVGGAEVALKEITDRISDIEFHMLTLNFGGEAKEEKIGNVFVHRIGNNASYLSKILFIPRAAFAARTLHRKQPFDGAWAMMSYMVFPLVVLRLMGVRLPYVLSLQDGDPFEQVFKRWFILPVLPLLIYGFRHAAVIQPLSQYLVGWAKSLGYKGPIEIIPNGADVAYFSRVDVEAIEQRKKEIGKISGQIAFVSTSRLVHKNALDDVICALVHLPENIHFYNFGFGPDKKMLENLARKEGVGQRVHLLPHPGLELLPHYLQACDIFIRPSRTEGFGVSFIEAMAAGLPVIATQEGGIADFLYDAKRNPDKPTTGWAVDKDSPEQIAEAVKEILENPDQAARVTANAKKLVSENYDWNLIAGNMRALFN